MKKIYINPTLKIVKIRPAKFIATSIPTNEYSGGEIQSRRGRFSKWEEDDEE